MAYIWLVIQEDRHCDLDIEPFSTEDRALLYAEAQASAIAPSRIHEEDMEITDRMIRDGWVYYLPYGEDDSIRVVKRILDKDEDTESAA